MMKNSALLCLVAALFTAAPVMAHDAEIEAVRVDNSDGRWSFSVTLSHAETGWDDYADGWRVEDAEGQELGLRILAHPHENEQPFTRSLSGVTLPEGTQKVFIRARTLGDGWAGDTYEVILP